MNIRYRPAALAQIDAIFIHIAGQNPEAAFRVKAEILRRIDSLADFPFSCPLTAAPHVRALSIVSYPYIVFYTINEDANEVLILRIRHTSRNPAHHLD